MKAIIRHILFILFMALLMLPVLQKQLALFPEKPLHGAFIPASMPGFTWEQWLSGEFQEKFEKYTNDHIGFRNSLVRINNQLEFTLFGKTNAEGVVIGKNRYLYEYDYIRDYTGLDFMGDSFIRQKMLRTAFVQRYLKDSLDIDLVVIFEPGKASFYPEHIPQKFLSQDSTPSNYRSYTAMARETGVRHIDLNAYFQSLKTSSGHPLFPRYGTHWSVYGVSFAADSLLRYIGQLKDESLRSAVVSGYEVSTIPKGSDNDMELPLNLLFPLKSESMAYPVWEIDTVSEKYRPMVLAVADSYYWNLFNTRIPKHLFANEAFWYFNALVYPDTYYDTTWIADLDFRNEVEKQDIILVMVTERFLHKFDWRFIDMLYNQYAPGWLADVVYENINRIVNYDHWFNEMVIKAEKQETPLDQVLEIEAKYLYREEDFSHYLIEYGVEHFMDVIRADTGWYGYVVQKASEKGRTTGEQLKADAEYTFNQNFPVKYGLYLGVHLIASQLASDPAIRAELEAEARMYGCPPEKYLFKKSFIILREQEIGKSELSIRNTPQWLSEVKSKAERNGIPLDQMIRTDAEYIWNQKMK